MLWEPRKKPKTLQFWASALYASPPLVLPDPDRSKDCGMVRTVGPFSFSWTVRRSLDGTFDLEVAVAGEGACYVERVSLFGVNYGKVFASGLTDDAWLFADLKPGFYRVRLQILPEARGYEFEEVSEE